MFPSPLINAPIFDSYWTPFTANRQFKAATRMLAAAKDMHLHHH